MLPAWLNKKPMESHGAIKAGLWGNQSYLSLGESWPQKLLVKVGCHNERRVCRYSGGERVYCGGTISFRYKPSGASSRAVCRWPPGSPSTSTLHSLTHSTAYTLHLFTHSTVYTLHSFTHSIVYTLHSLTHSTVYTIYSLTHPALTQTLTQIIPHFTPITLLTS